MPRSRDIWSGNFRFSPTEVLNQLTGPMTLDISELCSQVHFKVLPYWAMFSDLEVRRDAESTIAIGKPKYLV